MANKYWYQTGADDDWDTLTGNWWNDAAHTQQAAAIPANGDSVYLLGATAPDSAPSVAVALALFDTTELYDDLDEVVTASKVSISSGGTLTVGDPLAPKTYTQYWAGTTAATGTFTFYDQILMSGTIGDWAVFNDASNLDATGIAGDYLTFYDDSYNSGVIDDYAEFNDGTANLNAADDYATFNDNSVNAGGVGDYSTFNDNTYVSNGTVGDYATFNSTVAHLGIFTGLTYYVQSPVEFDSTCMFTGVGTPEFILTRVDATVEGAFTSDGGTTPIDVEISIAAQADLLAANILTGKTILGVAGTAVPAGVLHV